MRYVILKSNISYREIKSRQEYLYDIFKVYTIPFYSKDSLELKSMLESTYDVLFVCGHNNQVLDYLEKNIPVESNVVLITCYIGPIRQLKLRDKNIFYTSKITDIISGEEYGFNYDVTYEEINFYNCKKVLLEEKLSECFERI